MTKSPRKLIIIALPLLTLPPSNLLPYQTILPYLPSNLSFHSRFLSPINSIERIGIISSLIIRKWRYKIWDFIWEPFEDFIGRRRNNNSNSNNNSDRGITTIIMNSIWIILNKLTTRNNSIEEYLLSNISNQTDLIEIQYPTTIVDATATLIKQQQQQQTTIIEQQDHHHQQQIPKYLIKNELLNLISIKVLSKLQFRLALNILLIPFSILLAKILLPIAQILLAYNLFSINQSWRGILGSKKLSFLLRENRVSIISNPEIGSLITSSLLQRWKEESTTTTNTTSTNTSTTNTSTTSRPTFVWGDLDKITVGEVEKKWKIYELGRTYERARRVGIWKGNKG